MTSPRAIAFYLPQFHPIPENDQWWGVGFTEWTNVVKARPLFRGHVQPHVPTDLGYYDLRCEDTRNAQARLAQAYGLSGFCYYHYWFNGKRLLERPFSEVLASGSPDFPFCLCWPNQTWTGIWHGAPNRVLIEQTYPGDDDYKRHFEALLPAFRDSRYITVCGKPVFVVYCPKELPSASYFAQFWRRLAIRAGLPGLYLIGVNHNDDWHPAAAGFDARILQKMPPLTRQVPWTSPLLRLRTWVKGHRLTVLPYRHVMHTLLREQQADCVELPCVIPNWDNTPRSTYNGLVLTGAQPDLFRRVVARALTECERYPAEERFVFIKSWNEWAEGNYLEPDQEFGHGYLQAMHRAIKEHTGEMLPQRKHQATPSRAGKAESASTRAA